VKPSRQPLRGDSEWSPADAVVVLACSESGATSADFACPHTNFAVCARDGRRLLEAVPEASGAVLAMPDAIALSRTTFGTLLTRGPQQRIPATDRLTTPERPGHTAVEHA
jgi:hypothetical protein